MRINKTNFIDKPFNELTREELHSMIRTQSYRRIMPKEMCEHYKVQIEEYMEFIRQKGFVFTRDERKYWRDVKDKEEKLSNNGKLSWNPLNVNDIPKFVICAIYDVEVEMVDGTLTYDMEEFMRAKVEIEKKLKHYERKIKQSKIEYSKLKPIELFGMRVFRGYNRNQIAKMTGLSLEDIRAYEKGKARVPKYFADAYIKALSIKKRHIIQLREILTGKSESVEDDRNIPQPMKLRVWARDKGKCTECGNKERLHYHHIERFSEGGRHTEDNLKLLCASCHAKEHEGERAYHMLKKIAEG